eukprot:scpid65612/ scgid4294/ 
MALSATHVCNVLIVVCLSLILSSCQIEGAYDSCMVKRMLKAGIPSSKAPQYEQRALLANMSLAQVADIPVNVLAYVLQSTRDEASAIQQCIEGRSGTCSTYSPCQNGGLCELSQPQTEYMCKCPSDFTGDSCQSGQPASRAELQSLKGNVTQIGQRLNDRTQFLGSGCNLRTLGYKYQTRHSYANTEKDGPIATMTFRKKYSHTVLKLTYSTNIRTHIGGGLTRWFFKIGGEECYRPTKIDMVMYQAATANTFIPAVLNGICESTANNRASNIPAGDVTITVNTGRLQVHEAANPASGWLSTATLEVQEMCPQF